MTQENPIVLEGDIHQPRPKLYCPIHKREELCPVPRGKAVCSVPRGKAVSGRNSTSMRSGGGIKTRDPKVYDAPDGYVCMTTSSIPYKGTPIYIKESTAYPKSKEQECLKKKKSFLIKLLCSFKERFLQGVQMVRSIPLRCVGLIKSLLSLATRLKNVRPKWKRSRRQLTESQKKQSKK